MSIQDKNYTMDMSISIEPKEDSMESEVVIDDKNRYGIRKECSMGSPLNQIPGIHEALKEGLEAGLATGPLQGTLI